MTDIQTPGRGPDLALLREAGGVPTVPLRVQLAALWAATMLLFAYGDIFTLFRSDVLADIAAGEVSGIPIGQPFLLAASVYVAVPAAMVFLSLVMPPALGRWTHVVLASLYAVTIAVSMIGEGWAYYLFLSTLEIGLLALVVHHAWSWHRSAAPSRGSRA